MESVIKREKRSGDRFDAYWLRDDAPAMAQVCDQFLPDWTALDWTKI